MMTHQEYDLLDRAVAEAGTRIQMIPCDHPDFLKIKALIIDSVLEEFGIPGWHGNYHTLQEEMGRRLVFCPD